MHFNDYSHAEVIGCLFESQVLHNVEVIQVFQGLALRFKCFYDCLLPRVLAVTRRSGHFDLFDGDHLSGRHVHGEVDAPEVALADQLAAHPLEDRYKDLISLDYIS